MSVPKQMANDDITELSGDVEVDLPILSKVIIITRWYVSDDQNLYKNRDSYHITQMATQPHTTLSR